MTAIPDIVASNIRKRRKELGWTQAKLAEELDVHPTFVGTIERGKKFPSTVTLERICETMQLRPYMLFLEDGVDNNPDMLNDTVSRYIATITDELPKLVKEHITRRQADFFILRKKSK